MFRNLLDHPAFLLILVVLVVVIFGAKRLPGAAQSLGRSMKIFKSEVKDLKDDKPAAKAEGATAASATGEPTSAPRAVEGRVVDADHVATDHVSASQRGQAPAARTSVEDVDDAEAARRWRESQRHSA